MELGTRIRSARESKGLSTTQLGYHLNRSAHTIVAYESGKITPTIPIIRLMVEILDVSIGELLTDVETCEGRVKP